MLDVEFNGLVNLEAEQVVIGSFFLEPELIQECFLKPEHFYDLRNQRIFWTLKDLQNKGVPIEVLAVAERVGSKISELGGLSYLAEIAAATPTTASFKFYQGVVLEYYERRTLHELGKRLATQALEKEPGEVRNEMLEKLNSLNDLDSDDNDDGHISNVLNRVYQNMSENRGEFSGTPTGFRDLDNMLGGLQKQDLIIVGARPSVGKTALVTNVLQNITKAGNPGALFSLEMPDEGIGTRMLSNEALIDAHLMRNAYNDFTGDDWNKTTFAMAELSTTPLHIFDKSSVDTNYIRRKCRMLKRKYPGQHIVAAIDYLQLIRGNPKHGGNRTQEISEISRDLKQIARELDMTIIALSQLHRGVEQRQDKRPMASDLRESGQIEQDADVIILLYRDDYYDKESEQKNMIEIIVAKQRNGSIGTVTLAFKKEYSKFINIDWGQKR